MFHTFLDTMFLSVKKKSELDYASQPQLSLNHQATSLKLQREMLMKSLLFR